MVVVNDWKTAYYTNFSGSSGRGPQPMVVSYESSPAAEVIFADQPLEEAPTASIIGPGTCFRQVEFVGILAGTASTGRWPRNVVDFMLSLPFQEDVPLQMFVYPVDPAAILPEAFVPSTPDCSTRPAATTRRLSLPTASAGSRPGRRQCCGETWAAAGIAKPHYAAARRVLAALARCRCVFLLACSSSVRWSFVLFAGHPAGPGAASSRRVSLNASPAAGFTVLQALLSTLLTLIVGLPAAYLFARYAFPGKGLLRALTTLPFILPTVVVAAGFNALLGPRGWLNLALMGLFGLAQPAVQCSTRWRPSCSRTSSTTPPSSSAWWATPGQLDPRLEQAARVLGATSAAHSARGDPAAAAPGPAGGRHCWSSCSTSPVLA